MIKIHTNGVFLSGGSRIIDADCNAEAQLRNLHGKAVSIEEAKKGTISYSILKHHNRSSGMDQLQITFDALASHDITYVGIIQTAKASGLEKFPVPYVLTNCHNSLCAVGGTINEDDHMFGLSAAKKYGGIYVPPHLAVIHMYMRERMAGCGKMILGSDSHTRYGALGTMAIGEGGGELVKQLLCNTYDINYPRVVAVYLTGAPRPGVGPQDVALAMIGAVFEKGTVKNSVMEFVGPGISSLPTDYRCGIDVMTTETACLSSIWETDEDTREFFEVHGRPEDYAPLHPTGVAYYDGLIEVDLSSIKPMIALPFHPSNVYEIDTLNQNAGDILREAERQTQAALKGLRLTDKIKNGRLQVEQGVIAGCAGGTYTNVMAAASILRRHSIGNGEFSLSVYPSSQPVMLELVKNGAISELMQAGATVRSAFCGPCFGAGDVPANGSLSIRHTTRNFPNREGSKPSGNQAAGVALMDARSIAATALHGGLLTSATVLEDVKYDHSGYYFDQKPYENRVYNGFGKPDPAAELKYGPNIIDWPKINPMPEHLLLKVVSFITDPVTTTDELIPSGETSSYRSNPLGLAEFTLSRRDPLYVAKAKTVQAMEKKRAGGHVPEELRVVFAEIQAAEIVGIHTENTGLGSVIYAVKPGDGSAREQAASCQRVLGGAANIAREYATKRYRSNLINWGMVPFVLEEPPLFENGSYLLVPYIRDAILSGTSSIQAYLVGNPLQPFTMRVAELTPDEKRILLAGCLINFNRQNRS